MSGAAALEPLVDVLLPNRTDEALDELAASSFLDAGEAVPISPVDQLLVAFTRRLLCDTTLGGVGLVQLPRCRHRLSLSLAICMHLLRLKEQVLRGPVVLVALDVDLPGQLRGLSLRNRSQVSLARGNPLSAKRLTRAGAVEPLLPGSHQTPGADMSLVYLNTRVGSPELVSRPPLVVIDCTSIISVDARERALRWASDHHAAATVLIADVGDESALQTATDAGHVPLVLPITEAETAALTYNLGRPALSPSPLSSSWLLWRSGVPPLQVRSVGSQELNDAIARAFADLAARPPGRMPPAMDYPIRLLNSGTRLASRVDDYRHACALSPRPGEGPRPLLNRLERMSFRETGQWRTWATARWGSLKVAVQTLWGRLEEENPKLSELWVALDSAERADAERILIRCHSRAAAAATRASLRSGYCSDAQATLWDKLKERVEVTTFSARFPPGYADLQILTGAPPPWLLSVVLGAEAAETQVLAYGAEAAVLTRHIQRWRNDLDGWRTATFRALGAVPPDPIDALDKVTHTQTDERTQAALSLPDISLAEVLDRARNVIDSPQTDIPVGTYAGPTGARSCIPVRLGDGRTWWVPNEHDDTGDGATPVLVVTAGGNKHRPVRELQAGDCVIIPAGDGTDSVHARLVAISRTNEEVAALDAILDQFRAAARAVLAAHRTQRDAIHAVRKAGAQAAGELPRWAKGTTIAPREPGDVAATFRAAQHPMPDLALLYSVADTLRNLHRALGRFVAAISAGRNEDAVAGLRRLVGDAADELLDEFDTARVVSVDAAKDVPARWAGRVR